MGVLFLNAGLLACTAGCREDLGGPITPRSAKGYIAFVGADRADPLWSLMEATARRYEQALTGFSLRTGVADISAPNAQINILKTLHTPQLRGLCIVPADTAIMAEFLEGLRTEGVVVVTMMTRLEATDPYPYAGVDDIAVGRAMADAVHQAVGEGGTIALLRDDDAGVQLADRYVGFKERLTKLPSVNVLREMDCGGRPIVAERQMREFGQRYPRLGAWVALDNWPLRDQTAVPGLLPEGCRLVTYGPFPDYWQYLADGTCSAMVGADYEKIVENALRMCATAARGQPLGVSVYLATPQVWTEQNLASFKVAWFRGLSLPEPVAGRP